MAKPPIAATIGFFMLSCASMMSCKEGGANAFGELNSRISAPPENTLGEPQITAAFTAGSASALRMPSMMPGRSTLPRPLTGGLFMVMTAMPSRTEYDAASLISGSLLRGCGILPPHRTVPTRCRRRSPSDLAAASRYHPVHAHRRPQGDQGPRVPRGDDAIVGARGRGAGQRGAGRA